MRTPQVYLADDMKQWPTSRHMGHGCYSLARPMSWPGLNLRHRISIALRVLTGQYDALVWDERDAPEVKHPPRASLGESGE